jgi:hypothetical protein
MKKLLVLPILVLAFACNKPSSPNVTKNQQGETVITLEKDSNFVVINDTLNGLSDKKTYVIEAQDGQTFIAKITTPSDTANIRINQIISPSGEADGPFGKDITYPIAETGAWKIILGGSLMQGDDYKGSYKLTLVIE